MVVMVKVPPDVDVPNVRDPVLLTETTPGAPVFTVKVEAAVRIGLTSNGSPISPVPEVRFTVPEVSVEAPVLVMLPAPLAVTLIVPVVPVETLAPIDTFELPVSVEREMIPLPDILSALEIVSVLPEMTVMSPDVSTMGPRVTVPEALMSRSLAPSVIVCPVDVKVPPLSNSSPLKLKPEISSAPETVKFPPTLLLPITSVPATILPMSVVVTVNGPAPPAMVMALVPFGSNVTVPVPASTSLENVTSLAVMVIALLVVVIDPLAPTVTLPVPFVVSVMPSGAKSPLLTAMVPLEPEVVSVIVVPEYVD